MRASANSLNEVLARYFGYLLSKKTIELSTIERKVKTIKSMVKNHGVDLSNPEAFVRFLNETAWNSGTKDIAVDSYRDYLDMLGLTEIRLPHVRREETLPFVPLETEIDAVLSATRLKLCAFLRLLKDTGARPIEAWRLTWVDVDLASKTVNLRPAKHSRPRKLRISEQTLNMLLALPRRNQHVFSPSGDKQRFAKELEHFTRNYTKIRPRIAQKLQNPRLDQISLRTFRHWKGTTEYMRTKDILHVKELLGHVNIQNTLIYIHLANAVANNEDAYICKVAKSVEEAQTLVESGFNYVTDMEGVKIFRKRK